jgi:UTP:GlnB (protein PII) uridylyltransferase
VHKQTVDKHTASVVEKLRALPEFKALSADRQDSLEIAAFLHDIGKGPKARWTANDGVQKVDPDHAVRAIPMVVEILTEHVGNVKQEEAELILKLVTYHDLAGEVLGKGRNEQQLIDVAGNKTELDMLFALGKADATSLVELWWDEKTAMALYGRCLAKIEQ